jgi:MFS family permease
MLSIVLVPSSYGSRVVRVSNSTTATISPPSLNADYDTINESSHLIPPHVLIKLKPPSSSTIITTSEVVMKNDYTQYIDMPIAKSINTWQLWSLVYIYMIASSTSLMVIYNINAITIATRQRPSSFFVSLIGLSNGLGRLVAGLVSDYIVQHNMLTRLQFYSLILLSMAIIQLGLSAGIGFMLFPSILGVGFLFGSSTCLIAVNVTDIFGQQYVATNFGFVDSAPILGSYVFATLVVNAFYRDNDISPYDDLPICTGAVCFQYAFYFNAIHCFVACFLCYYIHLHRNSIKVDQS